VAAIELSVSELSKRATVYFDPALHQALRIRAATSSQSLSELVDEAVRQFMKEDHEDLETYASRVAEPEISYETLLNDLKKHGKI
jgi:plasmid stability protein